MSTIDNSNRERRQGNCFNGKGHGCSGGHWSGANIAAMVLGFIIFWPLGLIVLAWTIMGHPVQDLPGWIRDKWNRLVSGGSARSFNSDENVVFSEYQQTQHDRIREIKEEIRRRAEAFREFRANTQRRKDQQEFDDFMSNKPENGA